MAANDLNIAQIGTMSPEDFAQQQALNRQQQMATMLMQQNQQPQGQMISGRYVAPSFFQNLQPVANLLTGAYLAKQGDTEAAKLAQKIRQNKSEAQQRILDKVLGTSDKATELAGPYTGNVPMPVAVQPGVKPDLAAALREIESPTNYYGAGKDLKPAILEQLMPKKPSSISEFEYALEHPEFAKYTFAKARASAPNVINQLGASLAEQAGKMFTESKATAVAGYNAINSADKILNSTNKAITGPLANARLTALQTADTLGITGKAEKEKIARTREVLQETGKLALAAPPRGQGQVSNYERDLYQRAASGDINFTPTELNLIAKRAREAGEYQVQQHNELLQSGEQLGPDVAKMAKLYVVKPPQPIQPIAAPGTLNEPTSNVKSGNVRDAADAILNRKPGVQQ